MPKVVTEGNPMGNPATVPFSNKALIALCETLTLEFKSKVSLVTLGTSPEMPIHYDPPFTIS